MVGKRTPEPGSSYCLNVDGCFYSEDRRTLISCPDDLEECEVLPECRSIADNAFKGCRRLRRVVLPDGLEEIGAFSFSFTAISSFACPPGLKRVGKKAFYSCKTLEAFAANDGLEEIGDNAFEATSLRELHLPAGIRQIGRKLLKGSWLEEHHEPGTLTIARDNPRFCIDGCGALYAKRGGRLVLLELMTMTHAEHRPLDGTVRIAPNAYRGNKRIESVELPEGLEAIGNASFQGCTALRHVGLPESLERIDADAFYDTALASIRLPRNLSFLGMCALITARGEARDVPRLQQVEVEEGNPRFSVEGNLLIEHRDQGDYLVCHFGESPVVTVPRSVNGIGPYALLGCGDAKELVLHDGLKFIHSSSFVSNGVVEHVRVDFNEPREGLDHVDLFFPEGTIHNAIFAQAFYKSASKWLTADNRRGWFAKKAGRGAMAGGGMFGLGAPSGGPPAAEEPQEEGQAQARGRENAQGSARENTRGNAHGDARGAEPGAAADSGAQQAAGAEKRAREWGRAGRSAHGVDGFEGGLNLEQVCASADRALLGLANDPRRFAQLALRRLATPLLVSKDSRRGIDERLRTQLGQAVEACSQAGDVATVRGLLERGYIDADTIDEALEAAQGAPDITVASYLLQVKREKFNKATFDFGI